MQLSPEFGFAAATEIVDYLAQLGVSHLYSSPCLQAQAGSTHGYDVVDHHRVSAELGGTEAHAELCAALTRQGLGNLLDVVPNHMAIGVNNVWWRDVLENGPASPYAVYFDVDWDPPERRMQNVVLLPILADQYGRALDAGELKLHREMEGFALHYRDHVLPVAPRSLGSLLASAAEFANSDELAFLAEAYSRLPQSTATDRESIRRGHRNTEVLRSYLRRLLEERTEIGEALDAVIGSINAEPDRLDELLERQNYRVAYWRAAQRDLGYRRFFDVNNLVGLRVEDERVFADSHRLALRWLDDGSIDGLRVDHIDGLRDPEAYLRRLTQAAPRAWIVVEKILSSDEAVRRSWPVAGTTGYDFLNRLNGLFIAPEAERRLSEFYAEFTGEQTSFDAIARDKKLLVMGELLGSDINRLTARLLNICEHHRHHRDHTRHELQEALKTLIACLPVYRTFVQAETGRLDPEDERTIAGTTKAAKTNRKDLDGEIFDFLRNLLTLRVRGVAESEFVMQFQQVTAPMMAKGVEDTAFYCFNRFLSLNEIGGDPACFGCSPEKFHRFLREIGQRWPRTLVTTATHDTKRGEDVRARLNLLSEIPSEWIAAVRRWSAINEAYRAGRMPDRNAEYLFYQTLTGAWPLSLERTDRYMEKAAREAKVHTSWTRPNRTYEDALHHFVQAAMADPEFNRELQQFVARLIEPGRINSMAQTLIKLTAPGIPDLYQGTELWSLDLVDPDNRRPVDYALRRKLLAELNNLSIAEIMRRSDEGLPKLWVVRQTLSLRRRHPQWFGPDASYQPLASQGAYAKHVFGFSRSDKVVTLVPRLTLSKAAGWSDTSVELSSGRWRNELTGEMLEGGHCLVGEILRRFPVGLLSAQRD